VSTRERMGPVIMRLRTTSKALFVGTTTEVQRSIVEGSEITGAPGQPVDTGALKASWIPEFVSESEWQTTTNLDYAPIIEDNLRGATLRSPVGGFHSVKRTVAGFPRIVEHVAREVGGHA
jgi:hypothetical protein